eukprot:g41843.t1
MTFSEDRHKIRLIGYPSSSNTSGEQRNYAMFFAAINTLINDDEHLAKIFPTPPPVAFKQPPNLKQTIARSKLSSLQDNIDHNTTQPCHGNFCKIFNMDTTITCGNTTHHVHGKYSYDSANIVYLICC